MIDWTTLNKAYPQACAFAIDDVGQAWLFGDVPRYLANRWCVNHGVWKMPLGLINPVPSNAAGSLQVRPDKAPAGGQTWEPQGPEPLKPGEKPKQVEPIHAKGWATSDPAPAGMEVITDAQASGAQIAVQKTLMPGVVLPPPAPAAQQTTTVDPKAPVTFNPEHLAKMMGTVRQLVLNLPAGAQRDQLLALLDAPG